MGIQLFSKSIKLPKPQYDSNVSIEKALLKRRSVRSYKSEPLTIAEISQLLWAAQGVTKSRGYRTAPSAGALYPLEVYIVAGNVSDFEAGIYKYNSHKHEIVKTVKGDKRSELSRAAEFGEEQRLGSRGDYKYSFICIGVGSGSDRDAVFRI